MTCRSGVRMHDSLARFSRRPMLKSGESHEAYLQRRLAAMGEKLRLYHVARLEVLDTVPWWICRWFPWAVRGYVAIRTRTARRAVLAER